MGEPDVVGDLAPAEAAPGNGAASAGGAKKAAAAKKATKKAAGATKKAAGAGGPGRPPRNNLAGRLNQSITGMGMGLALISPADGTAIIEGAEGLAGALDKLAAENPTVQRSLERWLTAGAWSGVALAASPIIVAIAANHGMVSPVVAALFTAAAEDDG